MNIISNAGIVAAGTGSGGGGGGASNLDSQTVTVGSGNYYQAGGYVGSIYIPNQTNYFEGYWTEIPPQGQAGDGGSISDGTSNLYGGASILDCYHHHNVGFNFENVYLTISGNRANSGWTTMTIGSTAYQRASGQYNYNSSGGYTYWLWSVANSTGSALYNPFSSTGTSTTVTFT